MSQPQAIHFEPSPHQASEIVGTSAAGQPIKVHYFGNQQAALRILVVGGQQGADTTVPAALDRWAAWLGDGEHEPRRTRTLERARLAILPCASPDRTDISRDSVELRRVESRVLHRTIERWQPNLIIDARTFVARQKHLLAHDLELCHNVFLDIPTNPAACEAMQNRVDESLLAYVVGQLSRQSILAGRYMQVSPKGSVRHASANIRWGRNLWALRFGIPTVMIVGRAGEKSEVRGQKAEVKREATADESPRNVMAIVAALQTTVDWAIDQQERLVAPPEPLQAGRELTIASRYAAHSAPARMVFFRPSTGTLDQVELPGRYTPRLVESRQIEVPVAYAIPRDRRQLLKLLARQGLKEQRPSPALSVTLQAVQYRTAESQVAKQPWHTPRRTEPTTFPTADQYAIYRTNQPGGHLLSLLVEPHSRYCHRQVKQEGPRVIRLEAMPQRQRRAA